MNWFLVWLFLHILAAVIAFGPIFVFPIIGTLVAQSPQNFRFAMQLNERIESRLVAPLALTMLVSGSGLIWSANINFFQTPFLIVAVILYLTALTIAFAVLVPTTHRLLEAADHMPASAPAGAPAGGGPPPEVRALIRRNQMFGGFTTVLFLVIIFLMIIQPGGIAIR